MLSGASSIQHAPTHPTPHSTAIALSPHPAALPSLIGWNVQPPLIGWNAHPHASSSKEDAPAVKGSKILGNFDIDESSSRTVGEQLGDALKAQAGKVIDLFREWDLDGNGTVDRKEFHTAMPRLGLDVGKETIDKLFDSWDPDGSGELTFKELQRILRGGGKPPAAAAKMGAAVKANSAVSKFARGSRASKS